jgi:hypothetical protein
MKKYLDAVNVVSKGLRALGERRRNDPALARHIPGATYATSAGGHLAVIIPLTDGSITGYLAVPTFRMERMSPGQLAAFRRKQDAAASPGARIKRAVDTALAEIATAEITAMRAVNGHGNGHADHTTTAAEL